MNPTSDHLNILSKYRSERRNRDNIIIIGNFIVTLTKMYASARHKINKETLELNYVLNEMDQTTYTEHSIQL